MKAVTETKVRAIGNSSGVVLPKEVLAELNLEQGDRIFLVKTESGYKLSPYDEAMDEQLAAARVGMRQYRNTLRELAK
jgi:putative addiction module antidote